MEEPGKFTQLVSGDGARLDTGMTRDAALTSILQPLSPNDLFDRQMLQIDKSSHVLTSEVEQHETNEVREAAKETLEKDNRSAQILAGRSEVIKIQTAIAYISKLPGGEWVLLPPEAQWEYIKNHIPSLQSRLASAFSMLVPSLQSDDEAFFWLQSQVDNELSITQLLDTFSTMELDGGASETSRKLNQAWLTLLSQWSLPNLPPRQWISNSSIEAWQILGKNKSQWSPLIVIIQGFDAPRQLLITAQAALSIPEKMDQLIENFGTDANLLAEGMTNLRQTPVLADSQIKHLPEEWQQALKNIPGRTEDTEYLTTMRDVQKWLNDSMNLTKQDLNHRSHAFDRLVNWGQDLFELPPYALFTEKLVEQASSILNLQSSISGLKNYINTLPEHNRGLIVLHMMLGHPELSKALGPMLNWKNPVFMQIVNEYIHSVVDELPENVLKRLPFYRNEEILLSLEWMEKNKPKKAPKWLLEIAEFDPNLVNLLLMGVGFPTLIELRQPEDQEQYRPKELSEVNEEYEINKLIKQARYADRNVNNLFNIWGVNDFMDILQLLPIGQRELVKVVYRKFPKLAYLLIKSKKTRIDPRLYTRLERQRITEVVERAHPKHPPLSNMWHGKFT